MANCGLDNGAWAGVRWESPCMALVVCDQEEEAPHMVPVVCDREEELPCMAPVVCDREEEPPCMALVVCDREEEPPHMVPGGICNPEEPYGGPKAGREKEVSHMVFEENTVRIGFCTDRGRGYWDSTVLAAEPV